MKHEPGNSNSRSRGSKTLPSSMSFAQLLEIFFLMHGKRKIQFILFPFFSFPFLLLRRTVSKRYRATCAFSSCPIPPSRQDCNHLIGYFVFLG